MTNALYILTQTQVQARRLAKLFGYAPHEYYWVDGAITFAGETNGLLLVHESAKHRNDSHALVQRAKVVHRMTVLHVSEG